MHKLQNNTNDVNVANELTPISYNKCVCPDPKLHIETIDIYDKRIDWYVYESEPPTNGDTPCCGHKYTLLPQEEYDNWGNKNLCSSYSEDRTCEPDISTDKLRFISLSAYEHDEPPEPHELIDNDYINVKCPIGWSPHISYHKTQNQTIEKKNDHIRTYTTNTHSDSILSEMSGGRMGVNITGDNPRKEHLYNLRCVPDACLDTDIPADDPAGIPADDPAWVPDCLEGGPLGNYTYSIRDPVTQRCTYYNDPAELQPPQESQKGSGPKEPGPKGPGTKESGPKESEPKESGPKESEPKESLWNRITDFVSYKNLFQLLLVLALILVVWRRIRSLVKKDKQRRVAELATAV